MYSSAISKELDPSLSLLSFADDHAIVKEFNPKLQTEEIYVIDLLVTNLDNIKTWMNLLKINLTIYSFEHLRKMTEKYRAPSGDQTQCLSHYGWVH